MSETNYADTRLQAHYQVEAMCDSLLNAAREARVDALPYLVQSLSLRIRDLNGALMQMADEQQPGHLEDLYLAVYGLGLSEEAANGTE